MSILEACRCLTCHILSKNPQKEVSMKVLALSLLVALSSGVVLAECEKGCSCGCPCEKKPVAEKKECGCCSLSTCPKCCDKKEKKAPKAKKECKKCKKCTKCEKKSCTRCDKKCSDCKCRKSTCCGDKKAKEEMPMPVEVR